MTDTWELAEQLEAMARDVIHNTALAPVLAEASDRLRALYYAKESPLKPIATLANNCMEVVLLRRTGEATVKATIGRVDNSGKLHGWHGVRPPTHWAVAPKLESQK